MMAVTLSLHFTAADGFDGFDGAAAPLRIEFECVRAALEALIDVAAVTA